MSVPLPHWSIGSGMSLYTRQTSSREQMGNWATGEWETGLEGEGRARILELGLTAAAADLVSKPICNPTSRISHFPQTELGCLLPQYTGDIWSCLSADKHGYAGQWMTLSPGQ